ncbi:pentapeptide repeat-containing protein [Synechococcus sp. YX-04-1]|uniref:pentapeptide repeat-containing protein n=1 Tax=Synechococcus sp. YX-04-1 TaxID=3062778 RepID=UPI0026E1A526|nr:pentapeptide repeat-containing protein [Synechococcus sp. YX-04-1]MDO6351452.1 pentapeptide repeat-containing protein [Synechococcus sp. YX-04-1]
MRPLAFALSATCFWGAGPAIAGNEEHLIQLLESRQCRSCQLNDVDLTHADLRDADLNGAHLQRANLSQARLDGADLSGSDLSFTSLQGASLRGTDLRNSRLIGTDLRRTDLTGALLDPKALDQSHWDGARGVSQGARSHAGLHNAGVNAAQAGRWPAAEQLFNAAIKAAPEEPLSWVARGLSRGEQGKDDLASRDLAHAGQLFAEQGDMVKADQLKEASQLVYDTTNKTGVQSGNGIGSVLLSSALSTAQAIAPIALKALMPMLP